MLPVAVPTRDQHGTASLVVVERPFVDSEAVEREEVAQPGSEAATNSSFRHVVATGGNAGGDSGEREIDVRERHEDQPHFIAVGTPCVDPSDESG